MACSNDDSFSSAIIFKPRKQFPLQHRPRMLKDFLTDDSNSCSSTGFKSFPRKPSDSSSSSTIRTLIENDLNAKNMLMRSRSKTASLSSTISAFQALITAVKNVHFTAIKSPPIIPRSLSRRLSCKRRTYGDNQEKTKENETKVTVTIKDIIRWRSFRDVIEEQSQALDLSSSSPHHYTTTTTTTTTTVSTATTPCSRSSTGSSWCDSDFTSEYLPCWNGNSAEKYCINDNEEVKVGKIHLQGVGEVLTEAATGDKVEERQQINSPVSVIDNIEFEDEESSSFFDESQLATMERTKQKLMQKIQRFEKLARLEPINLEKWMSMYDNASSGEDQDDYLVEEETTETNNTIHEEEEEEEEEKAWLMLNHVKETSSLGECKDYTVERLVLDFFRDELCRNRYEISRNGDEMLRRVKSWIDGEHSIWTGCENKEAYVKNMDKEEKWSMFEEEEQQELALAIENGMMGALLDELLIDLIS